MLFGFSVLRVDRKSEINKFFAFFTTMVSLWMLTDFACYQGALADYQTLINRLNIFVVIFLIYSLTCFSYVFPKRIWKLPKIIVNSFTIITVILAVLTLLTSYSIKRAYMQNYGSNFQTGPLFSVFAIYGVATVVFVITNLLVKLKKFTDQEKKQIKIILLGVGTFLFFNVVFNLFIPIITNSFVLARLGTYSTIIFVSCIAFAILKYKLFNLKIILTESAAIIINVISAIQIFTSNNISEAVLRVFFSLVLLGGSYILIRSVQTEIKQKENLSKLAKELQNANEHLQEVDKLKDDFLSMASHELNTPIAAIEGYLSMILVEKMAGEIPPKAKQYLDSVFKSSQRLAGMVKDLLNVSRIESNRIHIIWEDKPIEGVIDQSIMEIMSKAREAHHTLTFEKPKRPMPKTWYDTTRVTEILINIVGNAIKYTDPGGKITLRVTHDDKKIVVACEDNGKGIPKERQKAVFEKFTQVDVLKDEVKGTGLGMYIAKKFIELHKGQIWFHSDGAGKGTTFYFSLPILAKKPFDAHEGEGSVLH